MRDVVGRVIAARLEAGRGIADGTLRSISVGYPVRRYEQVADARDGTVHRAVD